MCDRSVMALFFPPKGLSRGDHSAMQKCPSRIYSVIQVWKQCSLYILVYKGKNGSYVMMFPVLCKLNISVYNSQWHGLCHSHRYLYHHALDYMSQYVDWTATLVSMWILRNVWEREWKWQAGNGVVLYLSLIRLTHTQIFRCAPLSVHPSCSPPVTSAEKARCTGWPSSPPSSRFHPSQRPSPLHRKWTLPFCSLLPPAALSAALWTGPRGGERWERLDRRCPQTVDRAGQTRRQSDPCPGQHCWRRWSH